MEYKHPLFITKSVRQPNDDVMIGSIRLGGLIAKSMCDEIIVALNFHHVWYQQHITLTIS